jgi:hypothetical protein
MFLSARKASASARHAALRVTALLLSAWGCGASAAPRAVSVFCDFALSCVLHLCFYDLLAFAKHGH